MTDFYSQRLQRAAETKEAKNPRNLPLQKPTNVGTGGQGIRVMAEAPTDPSAQPKLPDSVFKTQFDGYMKDPAFKGGMEEFATIIQAMRKDLNGVQLPPEVMQRRVEQVLAKYQQGAQKDTVVKQQVMGRLAQQMGGSQ